jgi:hypothetical protein
MTTTQPNLLQLAKQGDSSAIAGILSRSLPKEISVRVSLKESCLKVMLESDEVPDRKTLVEIIRNVVNTLNVTAVQQV